jgi:GT2 family glycosyltransferase
MTDHEATVIVCAYTMDRWQDITDGVRALTQQSALPREVILVVDHNTELAERARSELPALGAPLLVIENDQQRGLSGARNTGIAAATQPVIAFLDDDAVPEPSWLEELLRPFADPAVMVTGGRAVPSWPQGRPPAWFPAEFNWVVGCSYVGMPETSAAVRNVIGCSMAFRAEVFKRAGTFTEGIGRVGRVPLGCEETELCIRIVQADPTATIMYAPASVVHHRVSPDRTTWNYFRRRCTAEGRSKAAIGALIGNSDGTSTERDYTSKVLPRGVGRGLADLVRGDAAGARRAAAIMLGLLLTISGYVRSRALSLSGTSSFASKRPQTSMPQKAQSLPLR